MKLIIKLICYGILAAGAYPVYLIDCLIRKIRKWKKEKMGI
jgi:hypothetical protein|tara:strand:+ start:157 stop:279 length:123 start_codon:yes stop_codon:yes gene_type:complete